MCIVNTCVYERLEVNIYKERQAYEYIRCANKDISKCIPLKILW
jgi:hypothetical protein